MNYPSKFKIANQEYKVKFVDYLEDGNFGEFDSVLAEIRIARRVRSGYDSELKELQPQQIENSYWHEVFHCFNWHFNTETDEGLAQSFANFMCEYNSSISNETDNK